MVHDQSLPGQISGPERFSQSLINISIWKSTPGTIIECCLKFYNQKNSLALKWPMIGPYLARLVVRRGYLSPWSTNQSENRHLALSWNGFWNFIYIFFYFMLYPNGSIIAILQVEGRFFVGFKQILGQNIKKRIFFAINRRKKRPSTCKTAIMDPLGSIIAVLQVRGTFLAQNPLKLAKRKNWPRENYGLGLVQWFRKFNDWNILTKQK